ncbi:MAG: rod-binding protein [Nitrospirae bacterium]|nr:rod-binding protein [Nitrospirota bacterium]
MADVRGLISDPSTIQRAVNGKNDPAAIKEVAKEMEAMFANMMIKAMRETVGPLMGKENGGEMFTGMFDTEISRLMAERGLGLQKAFTSELTKMNEKSSGKNGSGADQVAEESGKGGLKKLKGKTDKNSNTIDAGGMK